MHSRRWLGRLADSFVFLALSLLVLSAVRIAFFLTYRSPDATWDAFLPALVLGARVDAKWLALSLIPAWALLLAAFRFERLARPAAWLAVIALLANVVLAAGNFGFFGFYGTPISPIVFGLVQDDTVAILKTVWRDWPVFTYLGAVALLTLIPVAGAKLSNFARDRFLGFPGFVLTAVVVTALLALTVRGSVGKFPLRQQDFSISPNAFINATVPGGTAALYEAFKGRRALELKGGPRAGLREAGFADPESAAAAVRAVLSERDAAKGLPAAKQPHVVLALMESMGRDILESHRPGENDTRGALDAELGRSVAFMKGICTGSGTFPSLEGILFDSPLTPITQSAYGRQAFPFSKVLPFREAGYKVVFLTAGPEAWRQIDVNFPLQGFDRILGAGAIHARHPEAEVGTWGIGDAWMFRTALDLMDEADARGEKLLLVLLSATNHPPHSVPDGAKTAPVDPTALPDYLNEDRAKIDPAILRTYQYASNALGEFVRAAADPKRARGVLVAATGDHNIRFKYREGWWHHHYGVPVLFWLPENLKRLAARADTNRWASHRDILPTLAAAALGRTPAVQEGRNLLSAEPERFDAAVSFVGPGSLGSAVGNWGAAALDAGGRLTCYRWDEHDRLTPLDACEGRARTEAEAALGQRALADYAVRSGLLGRD